MHIEIAVEGTEALGAYASIPIAYRIVEVLDLESPCASDDLLPYASRTLDPPILKDYDAQPGNHPLDWLAQFDVRGWGVLAARIGEHRVGGAVIVARSPDIEMLEGRDELALLWDIRVAPASRNHGIGTALLSAAESWARARGAHVLKVETQNTNVPACRFYASHGFVLRAVRREAYPELPHEVQFLWYKDLV
jgi:GNAT superfamily N-acetyltransferase